MRRRAAVGVRMCRDVLPLSQVRYLAAAWQHGRQQRRRGRVNQFPGIGHVGKGAETGADEKTFWQEVREAEWRQMDIAKQMRQQRAIQQRRLRHRDPDHKDDNGGDDHDHLRARSEREVDQVLGYDYGKTHISKEPVVRGGTGDLILSGEANIHEKQTITSMTSGQESLALPSAMSPACEQVLACRSAGAVLARCAVAVTGVQTASAASVVKPWLEELAVAAQVLGRWATGLQKKQILRDSRFVELFNVLGQHAAEMEPWQLVGALSALSRMGASHASIPALIDATSADLGYFNVQQVSILVRTFAQAPSFAGFKATTHLQAALVEFLRKRHDELDAASAAALAPSLVQLRIVDQTLSSSLAAHIERGASVLHVRDLAAASSSLVALRVIYAPLLQSAERAIQQNVHLCTPRGVVQLSMALSQGSAEIETFRDFLMPAARSFILDFGARDICTVAESFCKVGAADPDFLADLAQGLELKVQDMEAHEVSVALNVFAPVAHASPRLLPSVASQTAKLLDELSPRQLARVLRGLAASGCGSRSLFESLRDRAIKLANVFYGTHAVDALMALIEVELLTTDVLHALLGTVSRSLPRMPAQDHVAVLHALSRVPPEFEDYVPAGLIEEVIQSLRQRGKGPWRCDLEDVSHLLEALRGLRMQDEVLLELLLRRLQIALKKSDCTLDQFLRVLNELSALPSPSRNNVLTHLHRRPRLQAAIRHCFLRQLTNTLDLETEVALACAVARLGYEDEGTQNWLDRVVASAEERIDGFPIEVSIYLAWALASLGWQVDWNRRRVRLIIQGLFGKGDAPAEVVPLGSEALLKLAWSLAVLNEGVPPDLLADMCCRYSGLLPNDWSGEGLRQLQEVALHTELPGGLQPSDGLTEEVSEWLELVREAPRQDLYERHAPPRLERSYGAGRVVIKRYPYEHWLSAALAQLRLPHEAGAPIAGGIHRAAVAFKKQRHVIDVLGIEDLSVPAGRVLGKAELRRRQLMQLGWAVHPVKLYDLYIAVRSGSLRLLVSKMLSSFDPQAARSSSFRKASQTLLMPGKGDGKQVWPKQTTHVLPRRRVEAPIDGVDANDNVMPLDPKAALQERALQALEAATAGQQPQQSPP